MELFLKAVIIGLLIAIPIGPVGLLIMQRSIKLGLARGVFSGIGAAAADGVFGLLASLGLASLVTQLEQHRHLIKPLGSLVLLIVGIYFFFQKPRELEAREVLSFRFVHRYFWDGLSAFFLTLMNPMTILAFTSVFAGSNLIPDDSQQIDYFRISFGIFSGSLLWWMVLVFLAQPLKKILTPQFEKRLHQSIAVILILLAIITFFNHRNVFEKIFS